MFPTFTSFTTRHPRLVALIGITIFILAVYLWMTQYNAQHTVGEPVVTGDVPAQPEVREATYEEKMQILESLKSDTTDDVPLEEKMEVLESLKSDTTDDTTPEEKMKILESLKAQ